MTQNDYTLNLFDTLKLLDDSVYWLKRSYNICNEIGVKDQYSEREYDAFETLTSRYARGSDLIIQKVFKSIDKVEFEEQGTFIDVINRAHKRGFFESVEKIREIRELRNEITHEYANNNLRDIFKSVLRFTPELFKIIENIKKYCERYKTGEA